MPLVNYPYKPKYAYLDTVYAFLDGALASLVIEGYRTEVDDPTGTNTARQFVFYRFAGRGSFEIEQSKLYSSKNHALSVLRGSYFMMDQETNVGEPSMFKHDYKAFAAPPNFQKWTDLAGFSFKNVVLRYPVADVLLPGTVTGNSGQAVLTGSGTSFTASALINDGNTVKIGNETKVISSVDSDTQITLTTNLATTHTGDAIRWVRPAAVDAELYYYTGTVDNKNLVVDNCTFQGATMPLSWNSITNLIANVKSYDKETTIWTDGVKIGERT